MSLIEVTRGDSPLVLGLPHTGTEIPGDCLARLNDTGRAMADTDWHVERLYADILPDITSVRTTMHRYVIDVNRDPSGDSLYPGQNTTDLCPLTDFDGRPIYKQGHAPDTQEVARRCQAYHAPYHAALAGELERVKAIHGYVVLYDCHSIRSSIPFLFDGVLPDFNIGTNEGITAAAEIEAGVLRICEAAEGYRTVLNGRFKGGWTTRHYGRPADGQHAIQMELAESTYLTEEAPSWIYDAAKSDRLRRHLRDILETLIRWRPA